MYDDDTFAEEQRRDQNKTGQVDFYVYSWGKNKSGELSLGVSKPIVNLPKPPQILQKFAIVNISSGNNHSGVVSHDGYVYICGSSLHGKLGIEQVNVTTLSQFTLIPTLQDNKVKQIACGDYHTLCLMKNGQVFAWGGTLHQQLGQRTGSPAQVLPLSKKNIVFVDCGDFHSAALSDDGELFTWGGGGNSFNQGQLGHGHLNDIENPEKIQFFNKQKVIMISCGGYHTMAVTSDNELFSWGSGNYGELGLEPTIVSLSCGGHHSLILTNKGHVFACGYGSHGQLGLKTTSNQCQLMLVQGLLGKRITQIAAGWNHSVTLTDQHDVFVCGHGAFGQLGLGDEDSKTIYTHIKELGGKQVTRVFAGGNHSWAVLDQNQPLLIDYSPPSPALTPEVSGIQNQKDISADFSLGGGNDLIEEVQAIFPPSERVLQVVYSEVDMCHRFIRFSLNQSKSNQFQLKIDEFFKQLNGSERAGVVYNQLQNDDELVEQQSNSIYQPTIFKSYTFMMIFDPSKSNYQFPNFENQENVFRGENKPSIGASKGYQVPTSVGDMIIICQSDVLKDELQRILSGWFINFARQLEGVIEQIKFFEMRPTQFQH